MGGRLKGLAGSGGFLCIGEGAFVATAGFVLHVFALGYRHGTAVFRGLNPAGGGVDGRVAADGVRSTCRGQLAAVEINIHIGSMPTTIVSKGYLASIKGEIAIENSIHHRDISHIEFSSTARLSIDFEFCIFTIILAYLRYCKCSTIAQNKIVSSIFCH